MPEPHLRAADADRAAVADVLGTHMSAGRLSVEEYDERLTRAYAARTYGELDELTADLPVPDGSVAGAPGRSPRTAARTSSGRAHPSPWGHLWGPGACAPWASATGRAVWGQWLATAVIVTTIWLVSSLVSSLGSGGWTYPWPVWVLGPWGAVLLAQTLGGRGRAQQRRRLPAGTTSGATTVAAGPDGRPSHAPR